MKVLEQDVNSAISTTEFIHRDNKCTICVLTLKNGFMVHGWSACVDRSEFDPEVGESISLKRARDEVYHYLGVVLQESMLSLKY